VGRIVVPACAALDGVVHSSGSAEEEECDGGFELGGRL
jgi:hypothetical protein